jgi:hypothetical protein
MLTSAIETLITQAQLVDAPRVEDLQYQIVIGDDGPNGRPAEKSLYVILRIAPHGKEQAENYSEQFVVELYTPRGGKLPPCYYQNQLITTPSSTSFPMASHRLRRRSPHQSKRRRMRPGNSTLAADLQPIPQNLPSSIPLV